MAPRGSAWLATATAALALLPAAALAIQQAPATSQASQTQALAAWDEEESKLLFGIDKKDQEEMMLLFGAGEGAAKRAPLARALELQAPKKPGCWAHMPRGCPRHPEMAEGGEWYKDIWHDASVNKNTCEVVRPKMIKSYCAIESISAVFVEDKGLRPAPGDEFWDLEIKKEADRVAHQANGVRTVASVQDSAPVKFFPLDLSESPPSVEREPLSQHRKYHEAFDQEGKQAEQQAAERAAPQWPPASSTLTPWRRPASSEQVEAASAAAPPGDPDPGVPSELDKALPPSTPASQASSYKAAANEEVKLPSLPGCYVFTPDGCPGQPKFEQASKKFWVRDVYGEKHLNTDVNRSACEARGHEHYTSWCGVAAVRMGFVPAAHFASAGSLVASGRSSQVGAGGQGMDGLLKANSLPRLPTVPGCYVLTPRGCPSHPTFGEVSSKEWVQDKYGMQHLGAAVDWAACRGRGKGHYAEWCGAKETEVHMILISPDLGVDGDALPGDSSALWQMLNPTIAASAAELAKLAAADEATEECHNAEVGERCHEAVTWAMERGIHNHPEWYTDLTEVSTFKDFQRYLHWTKRLVGCPRPCPDAAEAPAAERSTEEVTEGRRLAVLRAALRHRRVEEELSERAEREST